MEPRSWPECQSSMLRGVAIYSDQELLIRFQDHPEMARYFVGLFCRHERELAAAVSRWMADPAEQVRWIHRVWLYLYRQLQELDPHTLAQQEMSQWLHHHVSDYLQRYATPYLADPSSSPPDPTSTPASLQDEWVHSLLGLSPALTCYLIQGLDALPGDLRFIVLLTDRFHWSPKQIAAQLQADGYQVTPTEVERIAEQARLRLFQTLPIDIRALYLNTKP